MWTNLGNILIAHRHMNVEIVTEAAPSPEKLYINGIFVAMYPVPSDPSSPRLTGLILFQNTLGDFHLAALCVWSIGYSDFHNLMRFTSKKMPNNILKSVC
jgi:hypothetical protein